MSPKPSKEKDDPEVTCPVCGGLVTLDDPFCPHCGAEFEEEEVEDVIEEEVSTIDRIPEAPDLEDFEPEEMVVEPEKEKSPLELAEELPEAPEEEALVEKESDELLFTEPEEPITMEEEAVACPKPAADARIVETSITDLSVISFAIIFLGLIGTVIMSNVRWFWKWVPSIEGNLVPYAIIGMVVIFVPFLLFRRMATDAEKGKAPLHPMLPSMMLALILFGFIAVILFVIAGPITEALKASQIGVSTIFIILIVVGIVLYIYDIRLKTKAHRVIV
jgi:RNA polymerase subunit RPABC4/transcription elongation factor Spt4